MQAAQRGRGRFEKSLFATIPCLTPTVVLSSRGDSHLLRQSSSSPEYTVISLNWTVRDQEESLHLETVSDPNNWKLRVTFYEDDILKHIPCVQVRAKLNAAYNKVFKKEKYWPWQLVSNQTALFVTPTIKHRNNYVLFSSLLFFMNLFYSCFIVVRLFRFETM
jgi:hypothetical protein